MTNENSNVINNQIDSSSQSSSIEPNILSPVNTKNLTINTSNDDLSSSSSLSSTSSITPVSQQANENKSLKLKRPRDNSCDTQSSSNDLNVKDDNSRSSPVPPPCKAAKMGYSIMNILAKDKKDDNSSNKENNSDSSNSPPVSPRDKQNNLTTQTQQQAINPFLLNPFLAAAAAAAQAGSINNSANQQAQINSLNPLLNNISNFALLTKQQNSAEFWPWLNMAAMSALYGLDKGYPNLFPQSLENSQFLLQQQQQRNQSKSMFMYPQADLIQNNGRSTPNDSNNIQQNLQIGQMVNNILQNHHQHHHQHLENDNHKNTEDSYNSTRSPIHHHNNSSSSASSSSSLNKTSTPHTNMNLNRFQVFNPQRQLNKNNESLLMNELKTARANNNNQGQISPSIHHQNRFMSSESLINEAHSRKLLNKSFGAEDDDRDDVISSNNGGRHGLGGASLGDDDDLDDDNLEMGEDDDLDGSNNGDSFDNMRKKKTRTVFSRNQVFQLESTFDMKRYLSSSERSSLANSLQLTETQIKIWFQNRRNKWKRQLAAEIESNNGLPSQSSNQQHQQTSQLIQSNSNTSNSSNNSHRNSLASTNSNTSSQRVIRVPVVYQSGETNNSGQRQNFMLQSDIEPGHLLPSSSTSSTHSSLTSPSNSANFNSAAAAAAAVLNNMATNSSQGQVNPTSLLSPSMLAAAAAASSLYYAAAASAPGQFSSLNLTNSSGQNLKQPLSSIL